MKKTYIAPDSKVYKVKTANLLEGSAEVDTTVTNNWGNGKKNFFGDDDEDWD